ncbi:SLC4A5, partial [Symbiodinium pilosum]
EQAIQQSEEISGLSLGPLRERNIADATLRSAWFADVCSFDCAKHHSLDLLDHLRGLL